MCGVTRSSLVTDGLKRSFEGLNLVFAPHGQGFGLEIAVQVLIALGLTDHTYIPDFPLVQRVYRRTRRTKYLE